MERRLRLNNLSGDDGSGFVKVYRPLANDVELRNLTMDEFGLLVWLQLKVNPHNGFYLGNFSTIGQSLDLLEEKARYLCRSLKRKQCIRYKLKQGQRKSAKFFVLGFKRVDGSVVDEEFIRSQESKGPVGASESAKVSEVKASIPKSQPLLNAPAFGNYGELADSDSEVSYKEKESEIKSEKEIKPHKHPIFIKITSNQWEEIAKGYEAAWLTSRLESYIRRGVSKGGPISFDRLKGMLKEDWKNGKPAKTYEIENKEQKIKEEEWRAAEARGEVTGPPEEFKALRNRLS